MKHKKLDPLFYFLDSIDLQRDAIKQEVKEFLVQFFSKHAETLTISFLNNVKNKDRSLQKKLKKTIIPIILKTVEKYYSGAIKTASILAKTIIQDIEIEKNFDFLAGFEWDKRFLRIKKNVNEFLISKLDSFGEEYVFLMERLLTDLVLGGVSQENTKKIIKENIENKGRETGAYFNNVVAASQSAIFRTANKSLQDAYQFKDIQNNMRWVTFFTRSCPDCIERHNRIMSYVAWEAEGLPRSGATVCRSHCHCVLVPAKYAIGSQIFDQPIPRIRAQIE